MHKMSFTRYLYLNALLNFLMDTPYHKRHYCIPIVVRALEKKYQEMYDFHTSKNLSLCPGDWTFMECLLKIKQTIPFSIRKTSLAKLQKDVKSKAKQKIKILFVAHETSVWPAVASLYEYCRDSFSYQAEIVQVPFYHRDADVSIDQLKRFREELQLPVVTYNAYDVLKENPDIVVYSKPYDVIPPEWYIKNLQKVIPYAVYIPYAFFDLTTADSIRFGYQLEMHELAWRWISNSQHNLEMIRKYSKLRGSNAVLLGFPRFDKSAKMQYSAFEYDPIRVGFAEKIKGRPVLFWNTHFSVAEDSESVGAFLQYREKVFRYFDSHQDVVLLWRPHPLLFGALQENGFMTHDKIEALLARLRAHDNIIVDQSKDYINAFVLSNALLTDGGSSMAYEYVATTKPIYYTVKKGGYRMPVNSVARCWYYIENPEQLVCMLERFRKGEDPEKEQHQKDADYYIGNRDGKNGGRVGAYLLKELQTEIKEDILKELEMAKENIAQEKLKIQFPVKIFENVLDQTEQCLNALKKNGLPFVLFGAGGTLSFNLNALHEFGIVVADICDNDPNKWGSRRNGIVINSFYAIKQRYAACNILITVANPQFVAEIKRQIVKDGQYQYVFAPELFYSVGAYAYDPIRAHLSELTRVFNLLDDETSKKTYCAKIRYMLTKDPDDLRNALVSGEYFVRDILPINAHEFFLDGGAFHGEDTLRLHKEFGGFAKSYCVELDRKNFHVLQNDVAHLENVECYNLALWSSVATLKYHSDGTMGSQINQDEGIPVQASTIDALISDQPVSFLKLDVEGSEVEVLKGAIETILANKPKLANGL